MNKKIVLTLLAVCTALSGVFGQVDSQWRGPARDGVYPGEKLLKKWPASGPDLIWSADGMGEGFSSPAVTADRIYVTGMVASTGWLYALDLNGNLIWKKEYGPEWTGQYPGARTAPTVAGDRIYLMSGQGAVFCFNKNGGIVWSVDTFTLYGAKNIQWGKTESLLVDGDRVYVTPGAPDVFVAALDRFTGKTVLTVKGNGDASAYTSPVIVRHNGRRLLLTMSAKSFVGIDPDKGIFLWSHPHETSYDVNANTPLYEDGMVFTVSGYGTGGQMFRITPDGTGIDLVWRQRELDSQFGASVLVNGYIYGSGHNSRYWHCLDWKTGDVQFSDNAAGRKGNIIYADGMLYCYSERGDMALVNPNPKKFDVVSQISITMGTGQHWAHPVIRDGRLYVRHGDVLMVYAIGR
ncbi:PQQ-binding-like beta-propeller repeat protein [bacterium]|nr:PQQ-binding-like beta-propeller repeat protein [bacterium]